MKKILALVLIFMMVTAWLPAWAEEPAGAVPEETPAPSAAQTVCIRLFADRDAARGVMARYGVPEERISNADRILAVFSALGVKVTGADGGVQIDLDLNGTGILSLGATTAGDDLVFGSTLFPNYLVTVSRETLTDLMEQYMPVNAAGADDADMTALTAAVSGYLGKYAEACMAAVTPGTPEQTGFDVGGCDFDTLTPMTVDAMAIAGATKTLAADLLKDEAVLDLMKSVPDFHPDEVLKAVDEAMTEERIPEVTAEVYTSSAEPRSLYAVAEATRKGAGDPACLFTLLNPGDGSADIMLRMFETGSSLNLAYSENGFSAAYITEDEYYGFTAETEDDGTVRAEVYVTDPEKPLAGMTVTVSGEGTRTLSLDPDGKTRVKLEDLAGADSAEASAGLMQDITAGLGTLMTNAAGAVPEFGSLISAIMTPQGTAPEDLPEAAEEGGN